MGGPIGRQWRSSWQQKISLSTNLVIATASVARPDGKTYYFTLTNDTWLTDADISERLEQFKDTNNATTGWQYTTSTDEVEQYDATGKLISITNRSGHTQTLAYSTSTTGGFVLDTLGNPTTTTLPAGLMISVTDAAKRSLLFGYDASNRIVKMTDPANGIYLYTYDINNNLSTVLYPDGKTKTYLYGETAYTSGASLPNALTGIIDENNARYATYWYDATGRAIKEEHAPDLAQGIDQYNLVYSTDTAGSPTSTLVTTPLNAQYTYNFTTILGVVKSTGTNQPGTLTCGAAASNIGYDANGNVNSRTDFKGNTTTYLFDLARNLETSRTEAVGKPETRTITTAWHSNFRLPTLITEPGRTTEMSYDAVSGNLLTRKITATSDAKVRQWTYTYTTSADGTLANLLKTIDGPRTDVSDITTYAYYPNGDLLSVSNALNHLTQITSYDLHGRPLTLLDPNGLLTTLTYTPRGWLQTRTVGGELTTYEYDGVGQIKYVYFPSGAFIRYDYDDAHRLTDIWDQDNNRLHYTLDAMGNRTQEDTYDALGATVATKNRIFDALSRLYQEIGALNSATGTRPTTTYGHDANGNQTWIQPPNQPATNHDYDALNRLFQTTDAIGGITKYGYNALDQLASVTDPRQLVTSYTLNALGDQTQLTSPDTGITNHTYDEAGNLKTSTDARLLVSTYTYDALNRVKSISYSSGTPVNFTYDAGANGLGRLTSMSDESGSTLWEYDPQGRVLTKTVTMSGLTRILRYRYDTLGRLDQITYPSGKLVAYGYTNNKITSISADTQTVLNQVQYHPFSGPKLWFFGNNNAVIRAYDQDNRLYSYSLGSSLRSLGFDDAGRINSITDTLTPGLNQTLGYDNLDRLTSWAIAGATQGYGYDANGNRTSFTLNTNTYNYTVSPTTNRINASAGPTAKTNSFDGAGNLQSDGISSFIYNPRGRLSSVSNSGGSETYLINGLGQRASKSGISNARFVYDEGGKLLGEYDPGGILLQETVYLGDVPVAVLR